MSIHMSSSLDELLIKLELRDAPELWHQNWVSAMDAFSDSRLNFLTDAYIEAENQWLNLPEDMLEAFYKANAIVRSSPALCQLVWLLHYTTFLSGAAPDDKGLSQWPAPVNSMQSAADMLHAIILVSGLPILQGFYIDRNIPLSIFKDTVSDLATCMEEYRMKYGTYGIGTFRLWWLLQHFNGTLFKLGRLQFIHGTFNGNFIAFRSRISGSIMILCEDGVMIDKEGLIQTNGTMGDNKGVWCTRYSEDVLSIEGNPVTSSGCVAKRTLRLLKEEWQKVLSKGDGVLDTHIPRGGRMEYALCRASYNMASGFFSKYFPAKQYQGFTCCSWLLDPSMQKLLPECSNISRFQRDFHLFPISEDNLEDGSVFEYVFNDKPEDLSALPAQTSLQRELKRHLTQGNRIISVGGFIYKDECG